MDRLRLPAMGYGGGRVGAAIRLGRTGGVDAVIALDPLGLDLLYAQAKCHRPEETIGRALFRNVWVVLSTTHLHPQIDAWEPRWFKLAGS